MEDALIITDVTAPALRSPETGLIPEAVLQRAAEYAAASKATSTLETYATCWDAFCKWAIESEVDPLASDPLPVAAFLTGLATSGYKVSTIRKYLAAIGEAYIAKGLPPPQESREVRSVLKGIIRTHGSKKQGRAPLRLEQLKAICKICHSGTALAGKRDAAMLLIGFAAALRRSELVALNVDDIEVQPEGLVIQIRKSKTDQDMEGREIGIPKGSIPATCPVMAFENWIKVSGIKGALWRPIDQHENLKGTRLTDQSVALVVKKRLSEIGVNSTNYSAHSLRAGFATEAARLGISEYDISRQTGHQSLAVLRQYIRHGSVFVNNAASKLGL